MSAQIIGIDNDPAMLRSAQAYASAQVSFVDGNIATWQSSQPVDVLVANAALQWDLGHLERLASLAANVTTGGWFAFQVPGNLDDPHHQAIREVRARPRWSASLALMNSELCKHN